MPNHIARRPARVAALIAAAAVAACGLAPTAALAAASQPEKLGEKKSCLEGGKETSHGGKNSDRTQKCNDGEWVDIPKTTTKPKVTRPSGPIAPDIGPAAR